MFGEEMTNWSGRTMQGNNPLVEIQALGQRVMKKGEELTCGDSGHGQECCDRWKSDGCDRRAGQDTEGSQHLRIEE
uniref:Uncharacterized protein n=1 Tax=Chromera velia CCMP2878 TaxID=1169474 RepID=A0A0G4HNE6_9ALVE|eukprot:Cvel_7611.t1-p1 / transcript=Cvel_7611.t1 / gene=Cvel_7611 / organism=Chromera_velia_CCMP2878 / gene_product=hypothetical protein / transcript_product=hypothetical protein / location=Cvel_scaffold401:64130-64354(+) / protein_length=75 / sequence_SO=supercontig / SO=protein_coding / is_pseudo=false